MQLIFEDKKKRVIKGSENINFSSHSSFHLIKLTARAQGEKQLGPTITNDEDLTFQIDGKAFLQLGSLNRLVDSPAAISGGKSHGLSQTVYFLTSLKEGDHQIILTAEDPPGTATFESLEVYSLKSEKHLRIDTKILAEDGDHRPWLTFVLDNLPLTGLTVSAVVKKRYRDSDDLKILVDGEAKTQARKTETASQATGVWSWFYRFWCFVGSLLRDEQTTSFFKTNLSEGLHYVEIYADRMPYVDYVELDLSGKVEKVRRYKDHQLNEYDVVKLYRDLKFGRDYNQLDKYIIAAVNYWNGFFLNQPYQQTESLDPSFVKALVYRESRLGYYPNDKIIDVMQVWDPNNPPQKAFLGKTSANEFITPEKIGHISYSYPKDKSLPNVSSREESIFWGVRWLYHKVQYLKTDESGELIKPYSRIWRTWVEATGKYNANPAIVKNYISEVLNVYKNGVDLDGNVLWTE